MDFELKTLPLAEAAAQKCDALVVVVPEAFKGGGDALSQLVEQARKAGDFEAKPGKLLHAYRFPGVTAARLVLAGAGEGSGRRIQSAVQAAVGGLKKGVKRLVVCLPPDAGPDAVRAAVAAAAETSYVYVTTKSKPEGRELERVTIAVGTVTPEHQAAFQAARGAANGIEFARELGNLPPNLATPTRLGEEAKKLAKAHGFQCEVLGPKEVA
ncbi:MAG TPA: M17 family peptidase N-terminal domain-containing protein, partial [Ramlibacter sp.]|nr:M17 family peptidase N-terminal domain-containing protein [Ramlibacter sp.]